MVRISPRRAAAATAATAATAAAGAILVAMLVPCASLQLAAPSERPIALYKAPSPYKEPGRPALSSLIVTSRPVHVNKADLEGTAHAAGHAATGSHTEGRRGLPAQWRRQLFVSTSLGTGGSRDMPAVHVTTSSTALGIGGGAPASTTDATLQHVSIECAKGQACSTTIPLKPSTPSTATFKPYSQEALHKFLADYATVTSAGNATGLGDIQQSEPPPPPLPSVPQQDQTPLASDTEPTNRLANLYLEEPLGEDRNGSSMNPGENSKSVGWSLMHATQHKHPYDDRQGWVTLEPVPWSTSHVSKWQSNVQPSRPWDDQGRPLGGGSPWNDLERPHGGNYNYGSGGTGKPWGDRPWSSGDSQSPKPWENNSPGGSWTSSQMNKWERPSDGRRPGGAPWPAAPAGSDIITGGGPPDFPPHQSGYSNRPVGNEGPGNHRPPSRPWENDFHGQHRPPGRHPSTHPEEGDGTWVLLSSTRGYSSPPRHRQLNQRGLTLSTSRRVRLTVLPADNSTNTTTAHGGLLEVEDSEQSVDESAAMLQHALAQHHNTTLSSYEHLLKEAQRVHAASVIKQALADRNLANATALNAILGAASAVRLPLSSPIPTMPPQPSTAAPKVKRRKVSKTMQRPNSQQSAQQNSNAETQGSRTGNLSAFTGRADGSTVALKLVRTPDASRRSVALAAVGAGLLPATMAMLVPLMLGRRRRSVTNQTLPPQHEEVSSRDDFIARGRKK